MMSLIAFFCVLGACLTLCGVSAFKVQRDKLLIYVTLKGLAILSILTFAVTCANLASNMQGTTLFILLGISFQIFSAIVSILPTKNDLFAPLYQMLDLGTALCLAFAGLLLTSLSPFGLPIGLGVGIIASLIIILAKKSFNWKVDISKYGCFSFAVALLGQVIVILINSQSIQSIIFGIGSVLFFAYIILKIFFLEENKKVLISKNLLYYLSLLTIVSSIFLYIY